MQYIKRKTNVRQHNRQTKHKVADVRKHERNIAARPILGTIALKNLTYKQAKKTFPRLKPYGDIDNDGVKNKRDCRPFDTDRQDDYGAEQIDEDRFNAKVEMIERQAEEAREERETRERELEEYERQQEIRDWGIEKNREARERANKQDEQSADDLLWSV